MPVAPAFANINGQNTGSIIPAALPTEPTADQLAARTAAVTTVKPSEPAVLSSDGAQERITDGQTRLTSLGQKGTTVGPTGAVTYADGSAVPAPQGAEYDPQSGTYKALDGKTYSAAEFYGQNANAPDDDFTAVSKLFEPLKTNLDANTLSQVNAIQQSFDSLKALQQDANAAASKAGNNALMLAGTTRYSPLSASGIALARTSNGINAIASLDAKENAAIAAAKQAQESGDMDLMLKQIDMAETIRKQKQDTASGVQTAIQKANTDLQSQRTQQQTDGAVASALSSGLTDPADILQTLTQGGYSVTSADVAASLKNFSDSTGAAGIKGLTGDVANFYALKATPGALPASILALPQDQQLAAYISMVNQAKKGVLGTPATSTGTSAVASDIVGTQVPAVQMSSTGNPDPYTQVTFLHALPGGETGDAATLVKGLADYSINPNAFSTRLYKGTQGMTQSDVLALAKEYDPTYDEKQYATRAAMQKYITTGQGAATVTAANTLIKHLQLLSNAAKHLPGHSMPSLNAVGNFLNTATGRNVVTNFNTEAQAVASEAAKVYKGGGTPAEGEIMQFQKDFNANMSPDQLQGAIQSMIDLMAGKLSTLSDNYTSTMGKPGDYRVLTPDAATALTAMGFDPSDVDPNYALNQPDIGSSSDLGSFLASGPASGAVSSPINWEAASATQ